jgi:hypothetical protein
MWLCIHATLCLLPVLPVQLFGQWLSTAYISFAQLGMPFPGAAALGAGWAWAGSAAGGASEAIGLDSFVQVGSLDDVNLR